MRFGRDPRAGHWISTWPQATIASIFAALLIMWLAWHVIAVYAWSPLQRHYISAYLGSILAEAAGLGPQRFALEHVIDRRGPRIATARDVMDTVTEDGRTLLTISAEGERRGIIMLRPIEARYQPGAMRAYFQAGIYGGRSLTRLALPALIASGTALLVLLFFAIPADIRRAADRRLGRRLKGPRLLSLAAFNKAHGAGSDGLAITLEHGMLRLPRSAERQHLLIMGGIGSGKSALIRQLLIQIRKRGKTAIVYDPHGEYVPQFYRPSDGDVILNPLDARCPFWIPGEEVHNDAEALAMAQALFVEEPRDQAFFTKAAREIFAYLLMQHQPSAEQLVDWMTGGDTLDDMLKGTPLSAYIHNTAPPQRTAVMATLTGVARTLATLPKQDNGEGCWSVDAWAQAKAGWIFLTSTPQTRARLIPLHSLWLDMLILRLMGGRGARQATFVLDEVASLHRLPQLQTAITENRKYGCPIILGCQGRSQLETRYGHDAETMLAQPATKVFLRTSEPRSAEWASDAIGKVEIERLEESRRDAWGVGDDNHQLSMRRSVEPLVMASELQGLPNLFGYLTLGNTVVPLHLQYVDVPAVQPAFVQRQPFIVPTVSADVVAPVQRLM